jgi:hypothetical protein
MRRIAFLIVLLVVAGAARAAPMDDELAALQAEEARVAAVAWRLAIANTELCPAKAPRSGLVLHDALEYGPRDRPGVMRHFGLTGAPGILAVAPDSPAQAAGIRPGDILLGVNDTGFNIVPPAADAPASEAGVTGARDLLEAALAKGPAALHLQRAGTPIEVRLTSTPGCAYRFQLYPSAAREASSDGRTIWISTALTRYAQRDEDLAVILGHEMAHDVLDHVRHPVGSTRDRERAADYVGLYLAARAGYDISGAPGFWRRFGADDWRARWGFLTHPSPTARARALAGAAAEIEAKRAAGQPLLPGSPPR